MKSMDPDRRQGFRRDMDATLKSLLKDIEREAGGKPTAPPKDDSRPINIGTINIYLNGKKSRFKRHTRNYFKNVL